MPRAGIPQSFQGHRALLTHLLSYFHGHLQNSTPPNPGLGVCFCTRSLNQDKGPGWSSGGNRLLSASPQLIREIMQEVIRTSGICVTEVPLWAFGVGFIYEMRLRHSLVPHRGQVQQKTKFRFYLLCHTDVFCWDRQNWGGKQPIPEVDTFRYFMKVTRSHPIRTTGVLPAGRISLGFIAPLGLPDQVPWGHRPAPHTEQPHLPLSFASKSPELSCLL